MGYTIYFKTAGAFPAEKVGSFLANAEKALQDPAMPGLAYESDQPASPVALGPKQIRFNGLGEWGHESFLLELQEPGRQFCKTNEKPYTLAVLVVLMLAEALAPGWCTWSDDGPTEYHESARRIAKEVLAEEAEAVPSTPTVHGILVDPANKEVRLVEIPKKDSLRDIYRLIDTDMVNVVRVDDLFGGSCGTFLYVDDMGLHRHKPAFTLVNQTPIAGKFVILREAPVADDHDEEDAWLQGVDFTVDAVRERIRFISLDVANTILEHGTLAAAAAYAAHDLHVERHGTTLFVTPKED